MGLLEDFAALRADVAALRAAVGRHRRVPESRWGTVTVCSATETRVGFPEGGDCIVTRSSEAVWVGANVLVQVQGLDRWIVALSGGAVPAGFGGTFSGPLANLPAGFFVKNGAAISRATYWRLFAAVGTTWGVGDGSTTFNLPNLVDRMSLGAGNLYALGSTGGSPTHTNTLAELAAHTHTTLVNTASINTRTAGSDSYNVDNGGAAATGSAGSGSPWSILNPYAAEIPIIKF